MFITDSKTHFMVCCTSVFGHSSGLNLDFVFPYLPILLVVCLDKGLFSFCFILTLFNFLNSAI